MSAADPRDAIRRVTGPTSAEFVRVVGESGPPDRVPRQPMRPPLLVKSAGAIFLTKQAALETVHSLDATEAEHVAALENLTAIARAELLP